MLLLFKKHAVNLIRSWVFTFVVENIILKDERWAYPLNGGGVDRR